MCPGGRGNPHNVVDHKHGEVDLVSLVQKINQALIHRVSLIAALSTRDNVLDDEPEQELVQWLHIPLLDCLRATEPWLLAQVPGQLQQAISTQ